MKRVKKTCLYHQLPRARALLTFLSTLACLGLSEAELQARELWSDDTGDRALTLNTSLKSVALLSDQKFPIAEAVGTNFWRLRFDLEYIPLPFLVTQVAYEQRLITTSASSGSGSQFLPQNSDFPYRVVALGNSPIDETNLNYAQGFDRLSVAIRGDAGQVTVGRQAIGWGRASFFTAVDLLAPFGTFQVDQEWKAGVDAIDAEWQVYEQFSLGLTAAGGQDFNTGALVGRAAGYVGDIDLTLLGGIRSEDYFVGLSTSAQLFDAEVHGEFATFIAGDGGYESPQFSNNGIFKSTLGSSYVFDVLAGLTFLSEYHFNGFGLKNISKDATTALDPRFNQRFLRGDFQTIGRHELASSLNLLLNDEVNTLAYAVLSPVDGSGLAAVGATWNYSENLSLDGNLFLPWGAAPSLQPDDLSVGSEYGPSPLSFYVSLRFYD